ncbi:hypothetical protein ACA910_014545 [Epithemia clementina (nom. ined.)]
MSKPFDYSKWDKIELSDDEADCHPNIDKESWFRMKHRSRVEREENEEKDKAKIKAEMEKADHRIKVLEHDLKKIDLQRKQDKEEGDDDDDDDDDDLDDREGLLAEMNELKKANAERQRKLDEYEKNKKWNVDNMFQVKEERTVVNPKAGELTYTETGFIKPKENLKKPSASATPAVASSSSTKPAAAATTSPASSTKPAATPTDTKPAPTSAAAASPAMAAATTTTVVAPSRAPVELGAMETYHEFTEKYANIVEQFMAIPDLEGSKNFLLQYADILLQENSSNYLLLASLEDEMNGYREKMKRTARQAQIVSNIAELAKTMKTHPGNVIVPFFTRLEQRQYLEEFLTGVKAFTDKIIRRAVTKKQEIDQQRAAEEAEASGGNRTTRDLADVPLEERLGPGGLDPLEVIETLPQSMVEAFESRDVEKLKEALLQMDPEEAQRHMDRCIASGLWVANA